MTDLSPDLLARADDVASFCNVDPSEVRSAMAQALGSDLMAMSRFGVLLAGVPSERVEAEILTQTAAVEGDFERHRAAG